jgi:hypothetical protein
LDLREKAKGAPKPKAHSSWPGRPPGAREGEATLLGTLGIGCVWMHCCIDAGLMLKVVFKQQISDEISNFHKLNPNFCWQKKQLLRLISLK